MTFEYMSNQQWKIKQNTNHNNITFRIQVLLTIEKIANTKKLTMIV